MTSSAVRPTGPAALPLVEDMRRSGVLLAAAAGVAVSVAAAVLVVLRPSGGLPLGAAVLAGGLLAIAGLAALNRWPQIAAWGAVVLFTASGELKLRVGPLVGVTKDAYVVVLVGLVVAHVLRRPSALRRLRPLAFPLSALGVLVGLYLLDPAGAHDASWLYGTRLLLEVLALLLVGLLLDPQRVLPHLTAAMTAVLPVEALLAWAQQAAGVQRLVYQWGYEYGAQVRTTSGGGLRTSGSFEDPFQLAALAVLGLALALFVASRWQATVLILSAVAVLGATSVRTAVIQSAVLAVLWALRRGWWRQALAVAAVGVVAGVFVLTTTSSAVTPGAPEEPLLFSLNGRSTAWSQAVEGRQSLIGGNGVGTLGTGSLSTGLTASSAPSYDQGGAPVAAFAGSSAFLDSSYAQVQSDVGVVGTAALLMALAGLGAVSVRRCRGSSDPAAWAACGVLLTAMIDWIGRSSLASYTTGFLTLYVLGVLLGASREAGAAHTAPRDGR